MREAVGGDTNHLPINLIGVDYFFVALVHDWLVGTPTTYHMKDNNRPSKETRQAWHANPANWKWGVFYYNKEDKRVLSPKRIKYLGWTINFANPYAIIVLLAIAALVLVVDCFVKGML